jgi:hypothetical protein
MVPARYTGHGILSMSAHCLASADYAVALNSSAKNDRTVNIPDVKLCAETTASS